MQAWYRALSRDEGQDDFRLLSLGFDVQPRVRVAQKILKELEKSRQDLSLPLLFFDKQIYEESEASDKKYKLFCICLTDIVRRDCGYLRRHSAEWDATVVRGWFDEDNTENASVFVSRAETFFQTHGKAALQHYFQSWGGLSSASSFSSSSSSSFFSLATSANPYTIDVVTGATWDNIPVDNRVMIWRDVNEQIRAERYRARVLCFQYFGREIALADRMELLLGAQAWVHSQSWEDETAAESGSEQLQTVERRLETRLRAVFDALFRPLQQDELNLNAQAWTQVAFRIQAVEEERETRVGDAIFYNAAVIQATSADGLHRVRLFVGREEGDAAINIRYVGPQCFSTFNNYNYVQQSGGDLRQFQAPLGLHQAAARGLHDPRVFDNWRPLQNVLHHA